MHRDRRKNSEICNVVSRRLRTVMAWVWLWSIVALTGCAGGGNEAADRSSAHELPPHYPENLAAGVGRLRELWLQLHPSNGQGENSTESDHVVVTGSDDPLEEFADLIEWLPELAAASDLLEGDWRICREVSSELSRAVEPLLSLDKLTRQQRLQEIATVVERGLQRLSPVVSEFERLEQRYRSAEELTDGADPATVGADPATDGADPATDPVDQEEAPA